MRPTKNIRRPPDAEVWGIDVGGPMVRYAHMRAVDLGTEVHFVQRLAEDTKFHNGHFDIVASYILHHEVTADATRGLIKEAHRILRPGGVYYPIDINTAGLRGMVPGSGPYNKVRNWMSHRWTHERLLYDYNSIGHAEEMRRVGFDVINEGPPGAITINCTVRTPCHALDLRKDVSRMTFALVRSLAFIWVAAVVLASLPAQAEILARQATVSGMTFDYKVILPDGYDADKTYDAMLAFPGGEQHMRIVDRMLEVNW